MTRILRWLNENGHQTALTAALWRWRVLAEDRTLLKQRNRQLEAALRVAVDDLYKAANQFAGLNPQGWNRLKFEQKARRAEKALDPTD